MESWLIEGSLFEILLIHFLGLVYLNHRTPVKYDAPDRFA